MARGNTSTQRRVEMTENEGNTIETEKAAIVGRNPKEKGKAWRKEESREIVEREREEERSLAIDASGATKSREATKGAANQSHRKVSTESHEQSSKRSLHQNCTKGHQSCHHHHGEHDGRSEAEVFEGAEVNIADHQVTQDQRQEQSTHATFLRRHCQHT